MQPWRGRPVKSENESLAVEPPRVSVALQACVDEALALAREVETIEAAYDGWARLESAHAEARRDMAAEATRLEAQSALLLGAMRSVAGGEEPGLLALEQLQSRADISVRQALATLDATRMQVETLFSKALLEVESVVVERVARQAKATPPPLEVMVRLLPNNQRILQAHRPKPDDAVLLLFALTGRAPTNYGYLFDDSTDDVRQAPTTVYTGTNTPRPTPRKLYALLEPQSRTWPVKGSVPFWLPNASAVMQWRCRGPVLEAEIESGDTFRNVLTESEAEAAMGRMLVLSVEGKVAVRLVRE